MSLSMAARSLRLRLDESGLPSPSVGREDRGARGFLTNCCVVRLTLTPSLARITASSGVRLCGRAYEKGYNCEFPQLVPQTGDGCFQW